MRLLNVIGIALTASLTIAAAYGARTAHGAEVFAETRADAARDSRASSSLMWIEKMGLPIQELTIQRRRDGLIEEAAKLANGQGAVGVLRDPKAPLKARRTLVVRDQATFEREVRRRFHLGDESLIAYTAPTPLLPDGRRVSGFVARVDAGGKKCDFAVAGYTATAGSTDIIAITRVLLCGSGNSLTPPDVRISALLDQSRATN